MTQSKNIVNLYRVTLTCAIALILAIPPAMTQLQIKGQVISAADNAPLPYASVHTSEGQFAFTNDDGYFVLKGRPGIEVNISYLGYRDTTIALIRPDMVIRLISDAYMTPEVVITDKNYVSPYTILEAARDAYQKEDGTETDAKLFVKRESVNNGKWADQTEVLYNYTHKNRRIYGMTFKHGKSYINTDNDIILTLDLFEVLKRDWVFDKKQNFIYPSILSRSSDRKMKKDFQASYSEYISNGVEYFVISSNPRVESSGFSSEITVDKLTNDFVEIHNKISNPKDVKFISVRTKEPINLRELDVKYQFRQYDGMTFLRHIDVSYTYVLNDIESINNLAFHFYDIGDPFIENITSLDYEPLTDYQKVWVNPYSEDFWQEQNISESQLDTLTNYLHLSSRVKSFLQNKQFLTLEDLQTVTPIHFAHVPLLDDGVAFNYKPKDLSLKSKLHLEAFFHINAFQKGADIIYEVEPLINYRRSFISDATPLVVLQFKKEVAVIKEVWELFAAEIDERQFKSPLSTRDLEAFAEKYNQMLGRKLSKLDDYQFMDWSMKNPLDDLPVRARRPRF